MSFLRHWYWHNHILSRSSRVYCEGTIFARKFFLSTRFEITNAVFSQMFSITPRRTRPWPACFATRDFRIRLRLRHIRKRSIQVIGKCTIAPFVKRNSRTEAVVTCIFEYTLVSGHMSANIARNIFEFLRIYATTWERILVSKLNFRRFIFHLNPNPVNVTSNPIRWDCVRVELLLKSLSGKVLIKNTGSREKNFHWLIIRTFQLVFKKTIFFFFKDNELIPCRVCSLQCCSCCVNFRSLAVIIFFKTSFENKHQSSYIAYEHDKRVLACSEPYICKSWGTGSKIA